jgi:hypothetical protein
VPKANEGQIDRAVRVVLGLLILIVAFKVGGVLNLLVGLVALILLITGVVGICPAYFLIKINTLNDKINKDTTPLN